MYCRIGTGAEMIPCERCMNIHCELMCKAINDNDVKEIMEKVERDGCTEIVPKGRVLSDIS